MVFLFLFFRVGSFLNIQGTSWSCCFWAFVAAKFSVIQMCILVSLQLVSSGAIQPVRTGTRVPVQIHLGVRRSGSFLLKVVLNWLAYEIFRHFFSKFWLSHQAERCNG
jgi:hypothetical protein